MADLIIAKEKPGGGATPVDCNSCDPTVGTWVGFFGGTVSVS